MDKKMKHPLSGRILAGQFNHICFVGQGPNQHCWTNAFTRGKQFGNGNVDYAIEFAKRFSRRVAITGKVGETIAGLLGIEPIELFAGFRRENLNDRFYGKDGKGDKFNKEEGLIAAQRLRDLAIEQFVLLCRRVASCFADADHQEFCVPHKHPRGFGYYVLPHPSGINTWYNSELNTEVASKTLREFVFGLESSWKELLK